MKGLLKISLLLLTTLLSPSVLAAAPHSPDKETKTKSAETFLPCQTRSPNSGSFFNLNPIHILPPEPEEPEDGSKPSKPKPRRLQFAHNRKMHKRAGDVNSLQEKDADGDKEPPKSWHAKGHDYPSNFTMNFCGPVVEDVKDVVGVDKSRWQNVSAYYTIGDKIFSIGQQNTDLIWRGRKLTLNYTHGSPCPRAGSEHKPQDDDVNWSKRRKSTLISLLCERDPLAPKASIAFVGTNDECTYFFEARSSAACPAVQVEKQQVGPSGVFGLIFGIAFLVYLVGGVVYQRAVMHQRGWRQLPTYSLWHGIFSFVQDLMTILFSSCARCLGGQRKSSARAYNHVGDTNGYTNDGGRGGRRGGGGSPGGSFDENRLIDELDEEWRD